MVAYFCAMCASLFFFFLQKYLKMQNNYFYMQDSYVNIHHNYVDMQEVCNLIRFIKKKTQYQISPTNEFQHARDHLFMIT